jgi:hypothetical protein
MNFSTNGYTSPKYKKLSFLSLQNHNFQLELNIKRSNCGATVSLLSRLKFDSKDGAHFPVFVRLVFAVSLRAGVQN